MKVYLLMFFVSFIFAYFTQYVKNKFLKRFLFFLSFLPFFLVSAFRYDVGTDYLYRYVPIFNIILNGGEVSGLEFGYEILNKIAISFSSDYMIIFVITSLIILFLIFSRIYRDSKILWLSIYILLFGSFFFQSMNIVRQYISIAIIFFSVKYINEGENKKYYLFVLIASLFHTSSLCAFILPFLQKRGTFNIKKILIVSIIVMFFRESILDIIEYIFRFIKYGSYFSTSFNRADLKVYPLILNFIIYFVIYYIYLVKKKNNDINNIDNFYLNLQGMAIISLLLGNVTYLAFRFTYYFSIFQIISIPYFLSYLYKNKKYLLIKIIVIITFASNIYYTNILHNEEEVLPYYTIWDRR